MHHKEYETQPLKTFISTIGFGYVPYGKKKRFQVYRCRDVGSHRMMGNPKWNGFFLELFK